MIWKKTSIKYRLETATEEEVFLIGFLRGEETGTDGAFITVLENSLLSKSHLIIIPVLFLQKWRVCGGVANILHLLQTGSHQKILTATVQCLVLSWLEGTNEYFWPPQMSHCPFLPSVGLVETALDLEAQKEARVLARALASSVELGHMSLSGS